MTTRVGAVVEVNADTEEAQRDIRRFGRTVEDAAADLDRLGDEGREMGRKVEQGFDDATDGAREYSRATRAAEAAQQKFNDSIREFALGFVTIQGMIALTRAAVQRLTVVFEDYIEANEEARAAQERLTESLRFMSSQFGESVFGDGRAVTLMNELAIATGGVNTESGALVQTTQSLVEFGTGLVAIYNDLNATFERFGLTVGDAGEAARDLFIPGYREVSWLYEQIRDRGREANDQIKGTAEAFDEVKRSIDDLQDTIDASPGLVSLRLIPGVDPFAVDEITLPEPETAPIQSAAEAVEEWYIPALERVGELLEYLEPYRFKAVTAMEREKDAAIEAAAALRAKVEAGIEAYKTDQIEALQHKIDEAQKRDNAAAEQALANSEKIKAAYDARVAAAQDYATAVGSVVQQVAGGQAKALDAIKALIGQELIAKGQARLLEAAALFFVPGQQGAAVGLTAAASAMIAAGAALSKSGASGGGGSAVGAGVAPAPAVAQSVQRTDVTVISNFGVVGDPREAARVVADSVRTATREGYL